MFMCPICLTEIPITSIHDVGTHLKSHYIKGKSNLPLRCHQENCKSNFFSKICNYVRHFGTFHSDAITRLNIENHEARAMPVAFQMQNEIVEEFQNPALPQVEAEVPPPPPPPPRESFFSKMSRLKESMKIAAQSMIIELRAKGNIPFKISVHVVVEITSFVDLLIDGVTDALQDEFNARFIDDVNLGKDMSRVNGAIRDIKKVLQAFSSEYRIRRIYEQHPLFVMPQPIRLGSRDETVLFTNENESSVRIVSRSNNAQYVSIKSTLRALLHDNSFFNLCFEDRIYEDGVYSCFQTSSRYKSTPFFSDPENKCLLLQIFYDGLGITNALRGAATAHNSGMFYFTLLNLPPRYNASLSNIHLIAMCNSLDLKRDGGLDILLEKIVDELKDLESSGIQVDTPSGLVTVHASMAQFTGDNLGLNQVLGFVESFSGDHCCLYCYATREEMQTLYRESDFVLRTKEEYKNDVAMLLDLPPGKNHVRGVKSDCAFNQLPNFHVVENWVNDSMHTVLGVLSYVMGAVLYSISEKFPDKVTAESINERITCIFGSLVIDRDSKPCLLSKLSEPGKDMSPKQGAAQQWALFRYMPLILCDLIPVNQRSEVLDYWELLTVLEEIVDLVFAPKWTDSLLTYFSNPIENFLTKFKHLYPSLSIRPKLHFFVHFETIWRKNGALRNFWCMNFERCNGAIKLPSHIINNFRDPQYTLAYRHQCVALNNLLQNAYNRNFVSVSKITQISLEDISQAQHFSLHFEFTDDEPNVIDVCNKITYNGAEYRSGTFVIVGYEGQGYSFGKINLVICDDLENPLLLVSLFKSVEFDDFSFCYSVQEIIPSELRLCKFTDLLDPIPLDRVKRGGKNLIRLKHHVID